MAHSRTFDKTDPADADLAGLGAQEIRELKGDVEERMQLDHYFTSDTDTDNQDSDGHHKQLTLEKKATTPTAISGAGILFVKDETIAEMEYINSDGAIQITENGNLKKSSFEVKTRGGRFNSQIDGFVSSIDDLGEGPTGTLYTVLESGLYYVHARAQIPMILKIYLNDAIYKTAHTWHSQIFAIMNLDPDDEIKIYSASTITSAEVNIIRII